MKYTEDELIAKQLELEEQMTQKGAEKYLKSTQWAIRSTSEDGTAYGQAILAGRVDKLAEAINKWREEVSQRTAGKHPIAYNLLQGIDAHTLAFLTLKNILAGISAVRTLQFVGVAIGTAIEDELRFAKVRAEEQRQYDRITKGAKKRSAYNFKHIYAVRAADGVSDWVRWPRTDRLHVGIKMLELTMATIGMVELTHQKVDKAKSIKYVKATPETLEWIEKKNEVMKFLRPVYEPMVIPPRDWTTPFDGGYLSSNIRPLKMVKTKNRAYLQELEHTDMPIVYGAVNALQRTPWQINTEVLTVMRTLWDTGSTLAGIPAREGEPMPPKPWDIAENEEAKREWRIEAAKVHTHNLSQQGQRVGFSMALEIAERYSEFDSIYFPYQLDFRGRIYAVPHLNPQGADYHKSLLRFSNGKPLGSEGWKWLAIHGANVAGYDKVSLEDRVNWVLENEDEICAIADDPYGNRGWTGSIGEVEIDKPWQFLAFCLEWKRFVQEGEGFVSKLPVAMDGSCSGIQHFSAMLRDEIGGAAVNLIPASLPQDVYRLVADEVLKQIESDTSSGTEDTLRHTEDGRPYIVHGSKALAKQWLDFGVTRKTTKRSVMTLAYGSKEYGFKEQLMEDIIRPARLECERTGKQFSFGGDGYQAAQYMAKAIWVAVNKVLVKAGQAMRWLQEAASLAASEELPVRWTTPVGFPVMQAYPDLAHRSVKTAINGKLVYLTMYKEKEDKLDRRRQSQGIAPNFVHSCDAAHMMLTIVRATQEGLDNFAMIHDSFGTTAGDVEELYRIVRESFVEMYSEVEVIESFRDEIYVQLGDKNKVKLKPLPLRGTLDITQVVDSRYCFA